MSAYAMWGGNVLREIDGISLDGKVYSLDVIRIALTAGEPAQVPSGWQPIETAPKDGTPILGYDHYGSPPYIVEWKDGGQLWLGADGRYWEPTHWMPLPAAPTAGDGDD